MLIIGESGSIKTNALPNLTNRQPGVDKIYLYAKKIHIKEENRLLINIRESVGSKHCNDSKAFY